jgi:protein OS-9
MRSLRCSNACDTLTSSPPAPPLTRPPALLLAAGWCGLHVEGWWTYEVCYKKAARQFHKEGAAAVDQYALGNFTAGGADPNEVLVDASEVGGAVKYVRQLYSGGEKCSLTGEERSVEVRYACAAAGQTRITSLREPRSCAYVLTVATPRLCKHPAFQSEPPVVVAIGCYAQGAAGAAEGGGGGERAACAAGKDFEGGACAAAGGGSEEDVELTEGLGEGEEEEGPGLAGAALAANSSASVDGEVPDEGEEDADGVGLNAFVGGGGGDEYDDYYD